MKILCIWFLRYKHALIEVTIFKSIHEDDGEALSQALAVLPEERRKEIINREDKDYLTPVLATVLKGHRRALRVLLRFGADPDYIGPNALTALTVPP